MGAVTPLEVDAGANSSQDQTGAGSNSSGADRGRDMDWTRQDRADFATAMGESFADAVSPPVPFSVASPHECWEAVRAALGPDLTPASLAGLSETTLTAVAKSFGEWFEVTAPSIEQIREGVEATLARWPA